GSSGSMTNRERVSETGSSVNVVRCAMSTDISFRSALRHLMHAVGGNVGNSFLGRSTTTTRHGCCVLAVGGCSKALDATTLCRACTVVCNRGDVLDGPDFQASSLQ